jgi:hypothetical protein
MGAYALGFGDAVPFLCGLVALALIWRGMRLLAAADEGPSPWPGLLLLLACPLFWLAFSELYWDLFAAAALSMCLGHLAASNRLQDRHHSIRFGLWMAVGFLTKYTFPAFAFLPACLAGYLVWKSRNFKGLGLALGAFLLVGGPWLLPHLHQVIPYVFDSLNSESHMVDRASISAQVDPAYYLIILKDAMGWPGLILLLTSLAAVQREGGRIAIAAGVGGIVVLSWMGQQEARYLLPALPMLAYGVSCGFSRLEGRMRHGALALLFVIALPMLSFSAGANRLGAQVPAERMHEHHRASLHRWGDWPRVHQSFMPVSAHPDTFAVDTALKGLAKYKTAEDGNAVGLLLDGTAGELRDGLFFFRSARLGLNWDFVSLAPPPGGKGKVFGKFKGPFHAQGEAPTRFRLLYAATSAQDRVRTAWLEAHSAVELAQIALPGGLKGRVMRLENWVQTEREGAP